MILLSGLDILVALANAVAGVTLAAPLLLALNFNGGHLTETFVLIGLAVFAASAAGAARRNARVLWCLTGKSGEFSAAKEVDSYRSGQVAVELRPRVHRMSGASKAGRRSLRTA